jgi:TolB-like protein/DNA-binding winged helix-turn-helix (wHTH) protein/Flp pilus assembly protein TadD
MASDSTSMAGPPRPERYRFGDIVVDADAHTLERGGQPQALEPKAFAVLLELLRRAGSLVNREQLLDAVWGHRHVTPGVLTRSIAQLRMALDDDPHHPRYIQTQHALGYRFIGQIEVETGIVPAAALSDASPPITEAKEASGDQEAADQVDATPAVPLTLHASDHRHEVPERRRSDDRLRHRRAWYLAALMATVLAWFSWQRHDASPVMPAEPSIAVLPFTTLSDDDSDRYFAEGLAAEMLSALASVPGLKVAAWLPAEAIDRKLDMQALGQKLGVATVLDASVRRDGARLRISARLSDTVTGYTLWSQTYERDQGQVFETQSEIAREVAQALIGRLPDAGESLSRRLTPTRNLAAFDSYLRGVHSLLGGDDRAQAGSHFRQALALDKGFARAQAGLCRHEAWRAESQKSANAINNAVLACVRASNMDPGMGEVQLALGDLARVRQQWESALEHYRNAESDPSIRQKALVGQAEVSAESGNFEAAERIFRQALALDPDNARTHASLAFAQYESGKLDDAVASARRASELRPNDAHYWRFYGSVLLLVGNNAEAEPAFERSLQIEPTGIAFGNLGRIRYQAGDYTAAVDLYRKAVDLAPEDLRLWGNLGDALSVDPGNAAQAREAYAEAAALATAFVGDGGAGDAKTLAWLAWYRANLGEPEAALDLVRRSEESGLQRLDVALSNARTFALLGYPDEARQRLAEAREAGVPESLIVTDVTLRRAGLVPPASPPEAGRGSPGAAE